MSFQVHSKDLLARTGTLSTKSGSFATPHMFPVVDPNRPKTTRNLLADLDVPAIMTNAYLLRRGQTRPERVELHDYLGFKGPIATDSGAYQILEFGEVSVQPEEIVHYQEEINSDIAVILDVPTGFRSKLVKARETVDETIRRADQALSSMKRADILWVGPVQGGVHLREIDRSAREMAKRNFPIYALGSPTELMETQHYDILVDMIVTARRALPISKPLHLFGAGHPATFPFFASLGCDLFDSAAYALYAKQGKYFTQTGTLQVEEMQEFPCNCSTCKSQTVREFSKLELEEQEMTLARHNLSTCLAELKRTREMIRMGRLWELMETRARAHPAFTGFLERVAHHAAFSMRYDPVIKTHGISYYGGQSGNSRPELRRYQTRLQSTLNILRGSRVLVLMPGGWRRPFHQDPGLEEAVHLLRDFRDLSIVFYSLPFGPVPLELDEAYPVPHTDGYDPEINEEYGRAGRLTAKYVADSKIQEVFLVPGSGALAHHVESKLREEVPSVRLIVENLASVVAMVKSRFEKGVESRVHMLQ